MPRAHPAHPRPAPMLAVLSAGLLLALSACTAADGGASSPPSADQSAPASVAESMAPSAEESAAASEDEAEGTTVTLSSFAFNPGEITVSAGETVRFVNEDGAPHTVTEGQDGNAADGARFDEQVAAGQSVEVTFEEPGDYDVTCLFHSTMNMVVHVE